MQLVLHWNLHVDVSTGVQDVDKLLLRSPGIAKALTEPLASISKASTWSICDCGNSRVTVKIEQFTLSCLIKL